MDPESPERTLLTRPSRQSLSNLSVSSYQATALDVCYSMYGETTPATPSLEQFYEKNAIYENPFVTASSRSVIGDIHNLSRRMTAVDIPRPLAVLCTLFRLRALDHLLDDPLFRALRVWSDISDVSEHESFDGHRKVIIEHTLHILLLPGIHCEGPLSYALEPSLSDSIIIPQTPILPHTSAQAPPPFMVPSLPIPGTSVSLPSPLHSKLRIISRLSFNEQGNITHHRDFWDIKDVMGLVPGVSLAQWIGTRLAALGLSYVSRLLPNRSAPQKQDPQSEQNRAYLEDRDLEHGQFSV